ncbi:uncharacterized protein VTP21DRAFT_10398 [Calcarisporiella thermophila]|uniref:uncharacterized protein n=1 Tax=Calcarisporiella thermophila TaxID=911321 RepID=UPI0037443F14
MYSIFPWCPAEPIWVENDFTPCFRESLSAALSLFYLGIMVLFYISKRIVAKTSSPPAGYQPLARDCDVDDLDPNHNDNNYLEHPTSSGYEYWRRVIRALLCTLIFTLDMVKFCMKYKTEDQYWMILSLYRSSLWLFAAMIACLLSLAHRHLPFLSFALSGLFFIFVPISYLQFRSAFIHPNNTTMIETVGFIILCILCCLELITPNSSKVDTKNKEGLIPCPESNASITSILMLGWISPLLWLGQTKTIEVEDVWDLDEADKSIPNCERFCKLRLQNRSLIKAILKHFSTPIFLQAIWACLWAFFSLIPAALLKQILLHLENRNNTSREIAFLCAVGLLVSTVLTTVTQSRTYYIGRRLCLRVRALLIGEIYAKALRRKDMAEAHRDMREASAEENTNEAEDMNNRSESATQGRVINLINTDVMDISELFAYISHLYLLPIQILGVLVSLYVLLGWPALASVGVLLLLLPLNFWISAKFYEIENDKKVLTDRRLNLLNEIMQGIRIIKIFTWEKEFARRVTEIRRLELQQWARNLRLLVFSATLWWSSPALLSVATFATYTMIASFDLTASTAFTALFLLNLLKKPIDYLPEIAQSVVETLVSLERVEAFLAEEETQKYASSVDPTREDGPQIGFRSATFVWKGPKGKRKGPHPWAGGAEAADEHDSTRFILRELSVEFPVGKLSLVVGPTGSGKSSLLLALLGEMNRVEGQVFLPPRVVAYVSQTAWLQNATIRENILFGSALEEERYQRVIEVCGLGPDLSIFEAGDLTEIGEKGVTLSGGQKQRIALARAIYSRASHLLLDDCLSAVDAHTAKWIFTRCLTGELMRDRTCILVTHAVRLCLSAAHKVVVLNQGCVVADGTPEHVKCSGWLGEELIREEVFESIESESPHAVAANSMTNPGGVLEASIDSNSAGIPSSTADGRLVKDEERAKGRVDWRVYASFLREVGGTIFWAFVFLNVGTAELMRLGESYWLRIWAKAYDKIDTGRVDTNYYVGIYAVFVLSFVVLFMVRLAVMFWGSLRCSRSMHARMLKSVMRTTPQFFDRTPIGRIMNRFSKDIEGLDRMMKEFSVFIDEASYCLSIVVVIAIVAPSFLLPGLIITCGYFYICNVYLSASRELKRLDSTMRSPIFSHLGETLAGVITIRAFSAEARFCAENLARIDTSNRMFFYFWAANRWLSLRCYTLGGLIAFGTAIFLLIREDLDAGWAGMALSLVFTFTDTIMYLMLWVTNLEISMNTMERIQEYSELEPEAPPIVPESRPPSNWPQQGEMEVRELTVRYLPSHPPALKGISFHVKPREKIGIVGRTGSGKTTLTLSFLRMIELESGTILIDGLDITRMGLRDLRSSLTHIPQDPVLFIGSVRYQLDPIGVHDDATLWAALRRAHLVASEPLDDGPDAAPSVSDGAEVIRSLEDPITEGGRNLSVGQRQLLCLARALVHRRNVVILDEATASIDHEADLKIQRTIREELHDVTVICVAHRLRTVIDYDRVLVLDQGRVVEQGPPCELIRRPGGRFRELCARSGEMDVLVRLVAARASAQWISPSRPQS